jgi:hypothetical protein
MDRRPEALSTGPPCFTTTLPACPSSLSLLRLHLCMFALGTRLLGNGVQLVHDGQLTSLRTWSELQHYRARCSPELVSIFKSVQRDCLEAQQKIHGNHGRTRCGFNHHSMGAEKPFRLVTCIIHGLLSIRILPAIITPPSCGFALRGCKSDARRPVSHPSLHSVRILCGNCAALAFYQAEQTGCDCRIREACWESYSPASSGHRCHNCFTSTPL